MPFPTHLISVSINRPAPAVYAFASEPRNLARWARGLGSAVQDGDGAWWADSPMGKVQVRFAPRNDYGVLDHDVTLPSGETVHNPLRIQRNGDGADVVFTLHRRPGMSDADLAEDARRVRADLEALRELLEQ